MPLVLTRVAVRSGVALWQHRLGLIVAALIVVGVGAFGLTSSDPSATNVDCADTAMAALTHASDATARAAYDCLGPDMRTTSEDQFVASLQQRSAPEAQADRVADKQTPNGKIVFFTVSTSSTPPVGYIVYLDPEGKIARVE
jgi:hypothetical protein